MEITYIQWPLMLTCLSVAGLISWLLFRRYIFAIFDPWLLMVLYQSIIVGSMAYYCSTGELEVKFFVYILACYFALAGGMALFYRRRISQIYTYTIVPRHILPFTILLLLSLLVVNNLIIYSLLGVPALHEGARTITFYSRLGRGGGAFYYLNTGLLLILPILSMKALVLYRQKRIAYLALVVIALVLTGLGGKTAFLSLFFVYGTAVYYRYITQSVPIRIPKIAWGFLLVALVVVAYTFVNVAESGYESTVFLAFIRRIINTAAGPYYYFILNAYKGFSGLNLLSYHFSQITPYFGFRDENAVTLGMNLTLFSDLAFGTPGFGPNPTHYVISHIALGYAGMLYSFFLGALLSFVRYRLRIGFVLYVLLNYMVADLLTDGTLMPLYLFYVLILSPAIVVANIIANSAASTTLHLNEQEYANTG